MDRNPLWTDTVSGKLARRPEWDKLLDYLREGDEPVITRLSRMTRGVRHLTEITALNTTTPAGRFLFHVIGAMDEMLADLISAGTLEGLEAARRRGRTGGRKLKLTEWQVSIARQMHEEKATAANAATPSPRSPKPSTSPARPRHYQPDQPVRTEWRSVTRSLTIGQYPR